MTQKKKNSFTEDLVLALAEISNPKKTASNPFFKSKYATLEDSLKISTNVLKKYNMAVLQLNKTTSEGQASLLTRIQHKNGEFIQDEGVPIRSKDPNDPQKIGSAITYARRYGLQSILGMVGVEDDDANAASTPAKAPPVKIPTNITKWMNDIEKRNKNISLEEFDNEMIDAKEGLLKNSDDAVKVKVRSWASTYRAGLVEHLSDITSV